MSSSRSHFLSGTIFGVVLGILGGHFAIWRHVPERLPFVSETFQQPEFAVQEMAYDLGQKSAALPFFAEDELEPVDEFSEPGRTDFPPSESPLANAIAVGTVEVQTIEATNPGIKHPAVVEIATPAEEPLALEIGDAAPIETHLSKNDIAVRKAIDEELNSLPEQQRDIWFDSLKEMHVDDAVGVIRMWKAIGGPIPGFGEDSLILAPQLKSSPTAPAAPLLAEEFESSLQASIRRAILTHQRNLLMNGTPGFLRIAPRFHEDLIDDIPTITGIVEEFDFSTGHLKRTGNILDLMIQGSGMFEVADTSGAIFLTRRGRFSINSDRHLVLIDPDETYVLQPVVTIPPEVEEIQIDEQGRIDMLDRHGVKLNLEEEAIHIVRVMTVERLKYFRNGLYLSDVETVRGTPGRSGFGTIKQGAIEESNINFRREQEQIESLRGILDRSPAR